MLNSALPVSESSLPAIEERFDPHLNAVKDGFTRRAKQLRLARAYRAAIELLWQGLNVHPEHPRILTSLATVYLEMKKLDRAMTYAERALSVDSFSEAAISLKARILESKGEIELARRWYRQVLEVNPPHKGALSALARLEHASEPVSAAYGEEESN